VDLEVNLIGNTFAHHTEPFSSTHGKGSKFITWKKDNSAGISLHVDDGLFQEGPLHVKPENRYGWLLEAESITPQFYSNAPRVLDRYNKIFTSNESLLRLDSRFVGPIPLGMIWIKEPKIHVKTKRISMISSNKAMVPGHLYRLYWAEKLKNQVDMFGRGFNEIDSKEEGLNEYMFSVAIENCGFGMTSKNYFTEKILDCFATGTIPVYFGCSNIPDYFNPDGVIELNDSLDLAKLDRAEYEKRFEAVKDNFDLCLEYEVMEDYIFTHHLKDTYQ